MNRLLRAIGPFAAAIALALIIDLVAKAASWDARWTFALAGFGAAVLLLVGTPLAFGFYPTLRRARIEVRDVVVADKSAVRAEHRYSPPAPTESDLLVCLPDSVDEGEFAADRPRGVAARGTTLPGTNGLKLRAHVVDIGHT